jgi:tRNA(adenine34) deaminase
MSEVRILPAAPIRHTAHVCRAIWAPQSNDAMSNEVVDLALHERFMREAMAEAALAADAGDVPVGCVLVHDGAIIARAHNHRQRAQDPTAHAELIALRAASQVLGSFRMIGVTAYVTLEPCPMCAGALVNARVPRVVYGCDDPKAGAVRSLYNIGTDPRLNHRFELLPGVLAGDCAAQLSGFFADLRIRKSLRKPPASDG